MTVIHNAYAAGLDRAFLIGGVAALLAGVLVVRRAVAVPPSPAVREPSPGAARTSV